MTLEEALQHFGTGYRLCKSLKVTATNAYKWKINNFIPLKQQFLINQLVGNKLPIDMNKEDMELRLSVNFKQVSISE